MIRLQLYFDLLNTISAGLRPRLALPNCPISRCIHLVTALHSSHVMTCGRTPYTAAPVQRQDLEIAQKAVTCLHSKTITADVHAEWSLVGC